MLKMYSSTSKYMQSKLDLSIYLMAVHRNGSKHFSETRQGIVGSVFIVHIHKVWLERSCMVSLPPQTTLHGLKPRK